MLRRDDVEHRRPTQSAPSIPKTANRRADGSGTAVSPADKLGNVPVNANIRVRFSGPIDPLTVNGTSIQVSGGGQTAVPVVTRLRADWENVHLLCSDGLTGMVPEDEILRVVTNCDGDLERAAKALIDAANERGGLDNITAVLIRAE